MGGSRRNGDDGARDAESGRVRESVGRGEENGVKDSGTGGKKEEVYQNCRICLGMRDFDEMILCDTCDRGFHLYCLNPPLESVPVGDWICPRCIRRERKKQHEVSRGKRIVNRIREDVKLLRTLPVKLNAKLLLKEELENDVNLVQFLSLRGRTVHAKEEIPYEEKRTRKGRRGGREPDALAAKRQPGEAAEETAVDEEKAKVEVESYHRTNRRGTRQNRPRRDNLSTNESSNGTDSSAQAVGSGFPAPSQGQAAAVESGNKPSTTRRAVKPEAVALPEAASLTKPAGDDATPAAPISRHARPQSRSMVVEEIPSTKKMEPSRTADEPEKRRLLPSINNLRTDGPPLGKLGGHPENVLPPLPAMSSEMEALPTDPILPPLWTKEGSQARGQKVRPGTCPLALLNRRLAQFLFSCPLLGK